ncbi:MAG TPA: tetratricopeptide repeat protein [Ferruginibacter sp.]|nr:tetratricopeptide repeat protein [Ferruginibacter sp.]
MFQRFSFTAICLFTTLLVIAQAPTNAVVFYNAGLDHATKGSFPEAILSFKKAVELYKKYDLAYAEMGNAYQKSSKPDSALLSYKAALALNPTMANVHLAMGNTYRVQKKQSDEAINCYMKALETDSSNKVTFYGLAWCYNDKKEYDKAIVYAIKALGIDNSYRVAYNEIAHAFNKTKKYAEGIAQFKKNMAVSTVDLQYYFSGLCYIELKDKAGALMMHEELLRLNEKAAASLKKKIDAAVF